MAKNATPATLFELAQADAQRQYRLRMEQLEKARATLAELQKDAEAIEEAGITLDLESNLLWNYAERAFYASTGYVFSLRNNQSLLDLLLARGWVQVSRTNTTATWSTARLKRGRYRLIVSDLPPVAEERAQATQPNDKPSTEATPA